MESRSSHRSHPRESAALFLGTLAILCVGIFIFAKPFLKNASLPSSDDLPSDQTGPNSTPSDTKGLPFISVNDIWLALGQGKDLQFLDIRTKEAFMRSHIPYSEHVPEDKLSVYVTKQKGIAVIVFSLDQAELLQKIHETFTQQGISHFFVTGGVTALEKEHYPLISFGDPDSFIDRSKVTYLTAEEARKYTGENTGFVFLDVRSTQEFSFAHVKDALSIPLEMIEEKSASLDRSTTYLVYGNTMLDAFQAAVRLSDLNFALVRAISDSPPDIEKAGIPIEKGTGH
ncbi:MAG: hypothetical protein KA054_01065 [Candidatus Moranbacteria bacterium]|nr:hypothetical protein [Candidatus Moranbacteria bacterium]